VVLRLLSLTRTGAVAGTPRVTFSIPDLLRQGDHDANPARLLRARRERPGGCSAVEQRDERASFIRTWSASCPPGKG